MSALRNGLKDLPPIAIFRSIRDLWRYNFGECARSVEGKGDVQVRELSPGRYIVELSPDAFSGTGGGGSSSTTIINNIFNNETFITQITTIINEQITQFMLENFTTSSAVCDVTCEEDGSLTVKTVTVMAPIDATCA